MLLDPLTHFNFEYFHLNNANHKLADLSIVCSRVARWARFAMVFCSPVASSSWNAWKNLLFKFQEEPSEFQDRTLWDVHVSSPFLFEIGPFEHCSTGQILGESGHSSTNPNNALLRYPLTIGPCNVFSFYKPKPPIKWKTRWRNL